MDAGGDKLSQAIAESIQVATRSGYSTVPGWILSMTLPVINAVINFQTGPSFAQALVLGSGILDTNILADSTAVIVDVSNQVNRIDTNRGRTDLSDQFQTGSLTLRIVDQNGDFNPQNVSGPYYNLLTPMKKVQILQLMAV